MDIKQSGIYEGIKVAYVTDKELLREKQKPLLKKIKEAETFKKFNPSCSEEADEIIRKTKKELENIF
jgi:hypothetical protein